MGIYRWRMTAERDGLTLRSRSCQRPFRRFAFLSIIRIRSWQPFDESKPRLVTAFGVSEMVTLADLRLQILEMAHPARVRLLRLTTPGALTVSDADFHSSGRRTVGMIDAMTDGERNAPETIDESRAARIARGSGATTGEVIELVRSLELLRDIL